MWLLMKTAWRNLFRQRRRTAITASAMALSLAMAIPFYGLILGIREQVVQGITGMELGHLQVHNTAYADSKALSSTLRRPDELLKVIRSTPGVKEASARVHGFGLLSNDRPLKLRIVAVGTDHAALKAGGVRFGRAIAAKAVWRADIARACEVVVDRPTAKRHDINVGTVFAPSATRGGKRCERLKVVGVLRAPLGVPADDVTIPIGIPKPDAAAAFGAATLAKALIRGAAPVAITGVIPDHERRITFMADKIKTGRYLAPKAAGEILVGYRLARTMRLSLGSPVFIQASSVDVSTGSFYASFKVAGIYRTGVEGIDRGRVFLHLDDARKLMALQGQAHELVIKAGNAHKLSGIHGALARKLSKTRLRVSVRSEGTRAGIVPLPAPARVWEPAGKDAAPLVPDGLTRALDLLPGLAAISRRVYTTTRVRAARELRVQVRQVDAATLAQRLGSKPRTSLCTLYVSPGWAARHKLTPKSVVTIAAEDESSCDHARLALLPPAPKAKRGAPPPADELLALTPPDDDAEDLVATLPAGTLRLLIPRGGADLGLAGVEHALERPLGLLKPRLSSGALPALKGRHEGQDWPALLTTPAAKKLGVGLGGLLLVKTRDTSGQTRWRVAKLTGLLRKAPGPALILPYFEAQRVDAKRLNARAHELVLVPGKDAQPAALAKAVQKQLQPLVRTWDQINPAMKDVEAMQEVFMGILMFVIFAIAAMTVMNTMLMAVFERTREFGVLKSLGMRPRQVFGLILFETLFLALIAASVGGGIGVGLDHYLAVEGLDLSGLYGGVQVQGTFIDPVWKAIMDTRGIVLPMFMTALVSLIVSFFPALRAGRIRPVEAMRQHN